MSTLPTPHDRTIDPPRVSVSDVRPFLPRDPDSVWGRAAAERDRLFTTLSRITAVKLPSAVVVRSNPGLYPVEVGVECWFGSSTASQRVKLSIRVEPRPHSQFPIEYVVAVDNRGRGEKQWRMSSLDDDALERLMNALARDESWPDKSRRLRNFPWQLHLQSNRITGMLPDFVGWLRRVAIAGTVLALAASTIGHWILDLVIGIQQALYDVFDRIVGLHGDGAFEWVISVFAFFVAGVAWQKMSRGKLRMALVIAAAVICFAIQPGQTVLGFFYSLDTGRNAIFPDDDYDRLPAHFDNRTDATLLANTLAVVFALAWISVAQAERRRTTVVYNEGLPPLQPRRLRVADYWNGVIGGIGGQADEVRKRFLASLAPPPHPELAVAVESIVAGSPDGKEEREQIVLSFRRALVFCHVYSYGSNLYIGWDAHLNIARWAEFEVARRMHGLRSVLSVRSVYPSVAQVSEYDLHDLNCLIEWAHGALSRIARQLATEHKIDQEINFKIERANRNNLLASEPEERRPSRLRRLA